VVDDRALRAKPLVRMRYASTLTQHLSPEDVLGPHKTQHYEPQPPLPGGPCLVGVRKTGLGELSVQGKPADSPKALVWGSDGHTGYCIHLDTGRRTRVLWSVEGEHNWRMTKSSTH
jgi:hypothetical protein